MTRENVKNARETSRETERGVLDALEIDNSSSREVIIMFTITEKFSS